MGVLIGLIRGAALDDAVGDDREDPEHAEENADAAAEDEGDGAALPEAKVHEREVEARDEASTVVGAERAGVVRATVVAAVVRTIRVGTIGRRVRSSDPEFRNRGRLGGSEELNFIGVDGEDVESCLGGRPVEVLDERHPERLAESIRDLDALLAETAHPLAWAAHAARAATRAAASAV